MTSNHIKVATRSSPLALKQVDIFISQCHPINFPYTIDITPMESDGDSPEHPQTTKTRFVSALQTAVVNHTADVAVHSAKDMSYHEHDDLTIAAFLPRTLAHDVIVSNVPLPTNMDHITLATSSPRRISQLQYYTPTWKTQAIRGNLQTRLNKLSTDSGCDGLILAHAGIDRLGWQHMVRKILPIEQYVPAPGQGVIAIECAKRDTKLCQALGKLNHQETQHCIAIERAMAKYLQADCETPFGCHAFLDHGQTHLALYWEHSPAVIFVDQIALPTPHSKQLVKHMLSQLASKGIKL